VGNEVGFSLTSSHLQHPASHLSMGRGAFYRERSNTVRSCGPYRSENAGMSSEKTSENLVHRKPKVF
jgi:hypothetical protein